MPLLEIVRTEQTSDQVIIDLSDLGKKLKKIPVIVGDCTGFVVNRMFFPYMQAAMLFAERGTDLYKIDEVLRQFGMALGPFRLADFVGFREVIATAEQYYKDIGDRTYKSQIVRLMQKDKREGKTADKGKGFYLYSGDKPETDPNIQKYINDARKRSCVKIDPKFQTLRKEDIEVMILFPVVNEACRILAEGIAGKASDLDIASVEGMGFPRHRGGIMFWADMLGPKHIYLSLKDWSKKYGKFFEPCEYMDDKASLGMPLSSGLTGQAQCSLKRKRDECESSSHSKRK